MGNADVTRFARVSPASAELRRKGAENGQTRFESPQLFEARPLPPPEAVFNAWAGRMARTAREQSARGVFVFAISAPGELAGQVWLRADEALRTTSIGRHSSCELFLPESDDLSLRHLLVMVRGTAPEPRCRVIDLRSGAGFFGKAGEALSSVLFSGAAVFAVPGYWLVFAPTGQAVPWNEAAPNPWKTLPAQRVVAGDDWRSADELFAMSRGPGTTVASMGGLPMLGSTPLLGRSERPAGQLVIEVTGGSRTSVYLGPRALERGVLLGRDGRCLSMAVAPDNLSRVHAVVFQDEDEVFLADAGSTNRTWLGATEIRSAAMEPGARFTLGFDVQVAWEPMH